MVNQQAHIFIGYRRRDSQGFAGRLADDLIEHFGSDQVFRDDDIPEGSDFTRVLEKALSSCSVLMVVIGPQWVSVTDASGQRRLSNPDDWVRREIETAVEHGVRLLPVLVGNASMPTIDELPSELTALTRVQAFDMSDRGWEEDLERLVALLIKHIPTLSLAPGAARPAGESPASPGAFLETLGRIVKHRTNASTGNKRYARRIGAGIIRLAWLTLIALLAWYLFENHTTPEFRQEVFDFIAFVREKLTIVFAQAKLLLEQS